MDLKRMTIICLVLAIMAIGACASAKVNSFDYYMPDDFSQVPSLNSSPSTDMIATHTNGTHNITFVFTVVSNSTEFDDQYGNLTKRIINHTLGYYDSSNLTFHYLNERQVVSVTVPDEALLNKIIP